MIPATRYRRHLPPMVWRTPVFGPMGEAHQRADAGRIAVEAAHWVKRQTGRRPGWSRVPDMLDDARTEVAARAHALLGGAS